MNRPRVLIADDHHILVEGVRRILENEYEIAGTATNGRELIELAATVAADVAVIDVGMPQMNGIEAARRLRDSSPGLKIVFLTQQTDRAYVHEAFRSGGNAYVLKQTASSELTKAIQEAMAGRYYVSPSISSGDR